MSFFDDASLAFLPSGAAGKDGKAYSIKPTDGTGDFTFSRGSNLGATRVGADGLIEKGRENLTQNSVWDGASTDVQPTAWTKFLSGTGTLDVTATAGQIRFQTLDASSRAFIYSPTIGTNGIIVVSVYVDEVTTAIALNSLLTRSANATDLLAYEDDTEISYTDNVQAGKRYSVVFNKTGSTTFRFGVGTSSSILGDVVLSKPQIEVGLAATEYIESPVGSTGKAGILEDEPRFDYSGGASCPSLLLEPSRSNLLENSEWFESGSGWSTGSLNLETNADVSPEGIQNATKIVPTTDNVIHSVYKSSEQHADHIYSAFVKADGYNWVLLTSHSSSAPSARGAFFYIADDGTSLDDRIGATGTNVTPKIESFGNGWFRISIEPGTSTSSLFTIIPSNADDVISFAGDGTSGILIYGLQRELGTYLTSYIPNNSGGSVTRGADSALSSTLNLSKADFTLFVEFEFYGVKAGDEQRFYISRGVDNDSAILGIKNGTQIQMTRQSGGVSLFNDTLGAQFSAGNNYKYLGKWSSGDNKSFLNGVQKTSNTTTYADFTTDITHLNLTGSDPTDAMLDYGLKVKQVLYFPEALSDADCITLTTI